MITNEQIQGLSRKFFIDQFSIFREYLQILFLANLYNDKASQDVFFKGGTAIRLLFNSFRFSEDLDFTIKLKPSDIEVLVLKTIKNINLTLPNVGFKNQETKYNAFAGRLIYKDENYKNYLNIHLEFSYREKPVTKKESLLETLFPVSPTPIITHLDWNEILAEKVRALLIRTKGRDLFDIYYLLSKDIKLDMKLVNRKLEYYKASATKDDIIAKIKAVDENRLINDLNKYLPSTHRKITPQLKDFLLKKIVNE